MGQLSIFLERKIIAEMEKEIGHLKDQLKLCIREMHPEEISQTLSLFSHTVRTVNSKDYDSKQIEAWVDPQRTLAQWQKSFDQKKTVVAVLSSQIIGFADMDKMGYLDRLYVDASYIGAGVGRKLVEYLEGWAKAQGISTLETHASITAKPFFKHLGYQVIKKQTVICRGVAMENFVMIKQMKVPII